MEDQDSKESLAKSVQDLYVKLSSAMNGQTNEVAFLALQYMVADVIVSVRQNLKDNEDAESLEHLVVDVFPHGVRRILSEAKRS